MSRRREETAGLGLVQQADKGRVSDRLVKGIGQVGAVGREQVLHFLGGGGAQADFHPRAQSVETLQQGRHQGAAQAVRDGHPQGAAGLGGGLQGRFRLLSGGQQGAGIVEEGLARVGQTDRLAHPVEQGHRQFLLQLGDLAGHRRLGIIQLPGRLGKAVQFGHVQESVDVAQLHGSAPPG